MSTERIIDLLKQTLTILDKFAVATIHLTLARNEIFGYNIQVLKGFLFRKIDKNKFAKRNDVLPSFIWKFAKNCAKENNVAQMRF